MGRCPEHRHAMEAKRWRNPERVKRKAARYGATFKRTRQKLKEELKTSVAICPRCNQPILAGMPFDLDHFDGRLLPSHPECNRRAGGKDKT